MRQSNRAAAKSIPLQKESLFPANRPKQSADAASRTLLAWRGYVQRPRFMAGAAKQIERAPDKSFCTADAPNGAEGDQ